MILLCTPHTFSKVRQTNIGYLAEIRPFRLLLKITFGFLDYIQSLLYSRTFSQLDTRLSDCYDYDCEQVKAKQWLSIRNACDWLAVTAVHPRSWPQ